MSRELRSISGKRMRGRKDDSNLLMYCWHANLRASRSFIKLQRRYGCRVLYANVQRTMNGVLHNMQYPIHGYTVLLQLMLILRVSGVVVE